MAILTYFVGSVPGNWQYLYQDMWVVFLLTITMGGVDSVEELPVKRPSGNLLSLSNGLCVLTHMALCVAFQAVVFAGVQRQPDYVDLSAQPGFANTPRTMETTSLYYFSNFQYLLYAVLFARGAPWKRPLYTNVRFSAWCTVVLITNLALLFSHPTVGFYRADDVDLSYSWRGALLGLVISQAFCAALWELLLLPRVIRAWKRYRMRRGGGRVGDVYGHTKRIEGGGTKEYHRLRGEFERNWKSVREAMDD